MLDNVYATHQKIYHNALTPAKIHALHFLQHETGMQVQLFLPLQNMHTEFFCPRSMAWLASLQGRHKTDPARTWKRSRFACKADLQKATTKELEARACSALDLWDEDM